MNETTSSSARLRRVRRNRSALRSNPIVWGLLAAFLLAALITAYLTYSVVKDFFLQINQPAQPAIAGPEIKEGEKAPQVNANELTPLQDENGPAAQVWDGKTRVNVLVMGLDYADWSEERQGPARSDSMMLFTIDPESRTAGMLSLPRDLWVDIPGFGYGKLNTANFLGDLYNLEGGGPGLAMQTVANFLDLDIQYYAVIDFAAFEDFIDEIGGIVVDVPEEISVDPIGPGNTVVLQPGSQTLDGPVALAYARNRETYGSDFDRAQRQQQVVLAIRRRILDLDMLPGLIARSPVLYEQLAKGVHTNLSLNDIIGLAWLAKQIDGANIKRAAIGSEQTTRTFSPEGLDILQPDMDAVFLLRDELFTSTGAIQPAPPEVVATVSDQVVVQQAPEPTQPPQDLAELFADENARVELLNGTATVGLAAETGNYLLSLGVNVTNSGNADDLTSLTTIIDYSGKPYTVQFLVQTLQIQPSRIYSRYDPNSQVDITVILGDDWVEIRPNP